MIAVAVMGLFAASIEFSARNIAAAGRPHPYRSATVTAFMGAAAWGLFRFVLHTLRRR